MTHIGTDIGFVSSDVGTDVQMSVNDIGLDHTNIGSDMKMSVTDIGFSPNRHLYVANTVHHGIISKISPYTQTNIPQNAPRIPRNTPEHRG